MNQKRKPHTNDKTLILVLVGILAAAFCVIGVVIGIGLLKSNDTKDKEPVKKEETTSISIDENKQAPEPEPEPVLETVPQKIDFQGLWAVNPDAYAFIEIPGTQVNYPVMQSSTQEEDYYLNVTFEGVAALPGSIYSRMVNAKDFSDPITVIYGHDMLDGSYFGDLKNYVDRNFFDTYRDMYIYLPERQLHYQIIAEVVYGDMLISDSHDLKIPESVITFVDELKGIQEAQNQYAEDMTVTSQDRLVALSTCIGDRPSNRRLVVAKLVDEKLIEAQPAENAGNTAPEENTNTPENPPA
ncbi:class B sortase [Lachnospiraceae bacterium]|jgi:sortase B|nr:class B sortase [uncultured Schaedlerella sp.]NBI60242.1 class B sortase [Lachnospiraceae bacterium]